MSHVAEDGKAVLYLFQGDPWTQIFFDYNAMLVHRLKATVPAMARRWDQEKRCWWVLEAYQELVVDLLEEYCDVSVRSNRVEEEAPAGDADGVFDAMFSRLPARLHGKVYKGLSALLHPDKSGDEALMVDLNRTWDRFKHPVGAGRRRNGR